MLNHSPFHYIINIRNSLVSRKSLIFSMYVTSHLKTLIIFFNKIKYIWVIFYNSLWSHLPIFWQKEYLLRFLKQYWTVQIFICMLRLIWNERFLLTFCTGINNWCTLRTYVHLILDVRTLTCTLIFTLGFFYDFYTV